MTPKTHQLKFTDSENEAALWAFSCYSSDFPMWTKNISIDSSVLILIDDGQNNINFPLGHMYLYLDGYAEKKHANQEPIYLDKWTPEQIDVCRSVATKIDNFMNELS